MKVTRTTGKKLKATNKTKKIKTVGYVTPTVAFYPRNLQMTDTNPGSDMSC